MVAFKKKALCTLSWKGKIQAKLMVMVDPQGKTAKSGTPVDYFAKLNDKGLKAAQLIGTLDDTRYVCQTSIKDIQDESARVGGKCKAVEKALKTADDNQNKLLKEFNLAVDTAKLMSQKVLPARDKMLAALQDLENAKNKLEKFRIDKLTGKAESEMKALLKERDEAIKSIKEITKIAKMIHSKNLINIFDVALNKVATHSVKADYQPELEKLAQKIADLKGKSADLAKEIKLGEVNSAAKHFNSALGSYKAAETAFNGAMDAAAEARKNLMNELDGTSSRALADIMRARKIQVKYVEVARRNIWEYKTGLEGAVKSLTILSKSYKSAKDILKKAAKKDKSYGPDTEYGKAVYAWAFGNGHHLEAWKRFAEEEIRYCKQQEKYLNDEQGRQGPFGGFHKMNEMVKEARGKTRRELKSSGLPCPV